MVRLIDDLLDLSRITQGKIGLRRERVELSAVLQNAIETSRPVIEQAGHTLTVTGPAGGVYIDADVTRLSQVFSNLLNNAAKYTREGGRIWVTVTKLGAKVFVSVKDNGVGIPSHMLPQVFEMFTQVDRSLERSQSGLGIGLSISKQLVEMHGGIIEVRSDGYGKGSEFLVRLPALIREPQEIAPVNERKDNTAKGPSRRILVVDDNADSAASMAIICEVMGNDVRTARDGLQAVELAEVFRPNVILMDIGMPRLNGYEACKRIREQPWSRDMIIIALTGWGQEDDRRRSEAAGFNRHLVKPVSFESIKELMGQLAKEPAQ
jgi:CheY-like chemotaxis protein/two-component sensor histidine kinase